MPLNHTILVYISNFSNQQGQEDNATFAMRTVKIVVQITMANVFIVRWKILKRLIMDQTVLLDIQVGIFLLYLIVFSLLILYNCLYNATLNGSYFGFQLTKKVQKSSGEETVFIEQVPSHWVALNKTGMEEMLSSMNVSVMKTFAMISFKKSALQQPNQRLQEVLC